MLLKWKQNRVLRMEKTWGMSQRGNRGDGGGWSGELYGLHLPLLSVIYRLCHLGED